MENKFKIFQVPKQTFFLQNIKEKNSFQKPFSKTIFHNRFLKHFSNNI